MLCGLVIVKYVYYSNGLGKKQFGLLQKYIKVQHEFLA